LNCGEHEATSGHVEQLAQMFSVSRLHWNLSQQLFAKRERVEKLVVQTGKTLSKDFATPCVCQSYRIPVTLRIKDADKRAVFN
jgi:hypothetical protein